MAVLKDVVPVYNKGCPGERLNAGGPAVRFPVVGRGTLPGFHVSAGCSRRERRAYRQSRTVLV